MKKEKKTGVDILRPDKLEFRAKKITGERRKEGHHTMIEGPIRQGDIRALNT